MSDGAYPDFDANVPTNVVIGENKVEFTEGAYFDDGVYGASGTTIPTTDLPKTNATFNKDKLNSEKLFSLSKISSTGYGFGAYATNSEFRYFYSNRYGSVSVRLSVKYGVSIKTNIYNKVTINEPKTNHTITFTKTDEQGNPLSGAVYELYEERTDGDKLWKTYTTDENGTFTVDPIFIEDGKKYYFKEKTAPEGYEINSEKVPVDLSKMSGGSVTVKANAGTTITTNDGQTQNEETIKNGTFALGGSYTDEQDVEHYNDDIQLTVTPSENGTLKSLNITRTAGKGKVASQSFTAKQVENGEAQKFIQDAVKEYANVTITPTFDSKINVGQSDQLAPAKVKIQKLWGKDEEHILSKIRVKLMASDEYDPNNTDKEVEWKCYKSISDPSHTCDDSCFIVMEQPEELTPDNWITEVDGIIVKNEQGNPYYYQLMDEEIFTNNQWVKENDAYSGFTVEYSKPIAITQGNEITTLQFTNDLSLAKLTLIKSNQPNENATRLEGAEYKLERLIDKENEKLSNLDIDPEWTPIIATTNAEGKIVHDYVPYGQYKITETKAPQGYNLDPRPMYISLPFDYSRNETNYTAVWKFEAQGMPGSGEERVITLWLVNDYLYELPNSGGMGIYGYMIGGVTLMFTSVYLIYKQKRKGEKE